MSKSGIELIAQERSKQIEKYGYTNVHDSTNYIDDTLIKAAFAICSSFETIRKLKPVAPNWAWKIRIEKDQIGKLTIAGALIAAEIDRIKSLK